MGIPGLIDHIHFCHFGAPSESKNLISNDVNRYIGERAPFFIYAVINRHCCPWAKKGPRLGTTYWRNGALHPCNGVIDLAWHAGMK